MRLFPASWSPYLMRANWKYAVHCLSFSCLFRASPKSIFPIGRRTPSIKTVPNQTRWLYGFGRLYIVILLKKKSVCCSLSRDPQNSRSTDSGIFKAQMGPGNSPSKRLSPRHHTCLSRTPALIDWTFHRTIRWKCSRKGWINLSKIFSASGSSKSVINFLALFGHQVRFSAFGSLPR